MPKRDVTGPLNGLIRYPRLVLCGVPILPGSRHTLFSEQHKKCPLQGVLVSVLYFPEQLAHPQYTRGRARVGPAGPVIEA
jgi:hypothetical protein